MNRNKLMLYPDTFLESQKVYLISLDKKEEFIFQIFEGASYMANMGGVIFIWEAPVERIVEEQIKIINDAVINGADLIILVAMHPVRVSSAVEDAKARGVKIIYVDSPAIEKAIVTLATDNYNAGQIAGEFMINELESQGIFTGSIGIIGVTPELVTTSSREFGFQDIIEQAGRYQLLETQYAEGKPIVAQNMTEALIDENPELVGIFGTNEGATVGLGYALMKANKPIIGIGFDITNIIRDMLNSEVIKATLVQNPYTMGYLGMAEAIAALTGKETGPNYINTGVSIVTKYMREVML